MYVLISSILILSGKIKQNKPIEKQVLVMGYHQDFGPTMKQNSRESINSQYPWF